MQFMEVGHWGHMQAGKGCRWDQGREWIDPEQRYAAS